MTGARVETSYEPFSREPEYVEANRAFLAALGLSARGRILDLACGTGTLGDLLLERDPARRLVGLDLSDESLRLAREHFVARETPVDLVRGTADRLPFAPAAFDAVVMGNAIHNLPDAGALLGEIRRVLRPGGRFAFNSSFYAGTFPAGTEAFYHRWLRHALGHLQRRDRELRTAGQAGIPRRRGSGAPAFSRRWSSPDEWRETLARAGFAVDRVHERTVMLTRGNLEAVGAYVGLATVLLSGYPAEAACDALVASAAPVLAEMQLTAVPRNWLEVGARRSS